MVKICLDTDVVLDFLKGEQNTVEKISYYTQNEELCITSITFFELLSAVQNKAKVIGLLESLTLLSFDRAAAYETYKLNSIYPNRKLRELFIAGVCTSNKALLFTKSRQFYDGIVDLKLV